MPLRHFILKRKVLTVAVVYSVLTFTLLYFVGRTMPIGFGRVIIGVLLVYGFPLAITLAWVFSGTSIRLRARTALLGFFGLASAIWLINTSRFAEADREPYLIAHGGVHQTMSPEHNDRYTCSGRIDPPEHAFIENTELSIQKAFSMGARFVEIDIRETADGDFAVFHDDTLDCKTEAQGRVRDRTMEELKTLDVGYGYFTVDGKHPLRGKGIGMMRSLNEVLDAFPTGEFVVDVKFGNQPVLWNRLIEYVGSRSAHDRQRIAIFSGASKGAALLRKALPEMTVGSHDTALRCAQSYIIVGWTGYVPRVCHNAITGTFVDTGWMFWGWPTKLINRMTDANTIVIMRPHGQTEQEFAASIPSSYNGGIQTDRIENFRLWMSDESP